VHLAEGDTIQLPDEFAYPLERPQLGTEAMRQRAMQQRRAKTVELLRIELRRPPCGHGTQGVDAAFIKPRLPGVCRLPGDADCLGRFGRRLPSQHQPASAHSLACGLVHSSHEPILQSKRRLENACAANRLSCLS